MLAILLFGMLFAMMFVCGWFTCAYCFMGFVLLCFDCGSAQVVTVCLIAFECGSVMGC